MNNAYAWRAMGVALGLLALGSTTSCVDGVGGGSAGGASPREVDDCKDACNQLKFFDCNDSSDHAACFEACGEAGSSQIELFVACVRADVCDPTCSTDLIGSVEGSDDGGSVGGDGGGASSCTSACQDYVAACSEQPVDCAALCGSLSSADQAFVVYCESQRDGCTLPEECTGELDPGGDPATACHDACDSMRFFECLDAEQHSDCRGLCDTVDASTRDTFVGCANNSICEDSSCYDVTAGGGSTTGSDADVESCQYICDDLHFFDCITATDHADCRDLCTTASADRIETFKGCYGWDDGISTDVGCETAECYDIFAG